MRVRGFIRTALACGAVLALAASAQAQNDGVLAPKSAGALAFAPNGVLLVGDSAGGAVFAYETGDRTPGGAGKIEIADINAKIAALLGTTTDQVAVQDMAVNPLSGNVYLSVARGIGPAAAPVLLKADRTGRLSEGSLTATRHTRVSLVDAPAADNARLRQQTITDIGFTGGKVIVAGLSNEEFSSSLRAIAYPFTTASKGSSIEIYHGQHGRYETNSPVRTFLTYTVAGQPHILAAYTCTPLVRIPVTDLQPGAKVKGVTIAELGNRNQPLDIVAYRKDGQDYLLMSNSARGVMKLTASRLESYSGITAQTEQAGVPFQTIADLKDVRQLDRVDDANAVILVASADGASALRTVGMP